MPRHLMHTVCIISLLLLTSLPPAHAYPGRVAVAYPVEGIAVDGDLSDWPEEMIAYPLLFQDDGNPLHGSGDFGGSFRVGYSEQENALYIAVKVEDDSVVKGQPEQKGYNTQDGCEIYLHGHQPGQKVPVQYFLRGPNRGTWGPDTSKNMQVEVNWEESGYQLEWRIDIGSASNGTAFLHPEMELGFDVSIWDKDQDGTASWIAWSRGKGKHLNAEALGKLVLVEVDANVGKVLGLIGQTDDDRTGTFREKVTMSVGYQMFFSGVLLAFTLLHLLLFLFDPQTKANLFYSIYTGLIAVSIFSGFQLEFTPYIESENLSILKQLALLSVQLFGLCFLYSLFNPKPPRRFWMLVAILIVLLTRAGLFIGGIIDTSNSKLQLSIANGIIELLSIWVFVEILVSLFKAVRNKKEGAWTIGIGFSLFAFNLSPLIYQSGVEIGQLYWVLIPLVSMSVYLARSVTRTNKALHKQLVQVEDLSTKTREQYEQIQEQNLQIQEANRLKSDFLARMSHDLRTPMNAIIGYTRILLRKTKGALDERQYRNLENVQISANNLLTLINDILDLSKIEAGRTDIKIDAVDIRQLLAECATSVESLLKPGVQLLQELDYISPVRTDPDRMRRVLMNLLSNAVKFTAEGSITLSLKAVDGWAELAVADTGVGIPAGDLPFIFDEFRQADRKDGGKQEGTGLGLAIVKRSVELLGGTVRVESEEGRGAVFTLRIRDYEEEPSALSTSPVTR